MGPFRKRPHEDNAAPASPTEVDLDALRRQGEQVSSSIHGQGLSLKNMKELAKFAREAQTQGRAQMKAVNEVQQSGGGTVALMKALGMNWNSDYVKKVDCPSCGATKKLPSPSAYLYCDYCGALADYDFRKACEDSGAAQPGPEYAQLVNSLAQELGAAKAAGDRERYRALQHQIFDAYATACPKAMSHRISDPDYREKVVAYMADSSVMTNFDPAYDALMEEMKTVVTSLQWSGGYTSPKTGGAPFRALVDVCERQSARADELAKATGITDQDPDHTSAAVRERMYGSLFSQGWLPMLDQDDAAWLIDKLKLKGEYTKIEPAPDGQARSCGGCGGAMTALPGAKTTVCDHCGRSVDVGGAQAACGNCGAMLSFPVGLTHLPCPYCRTDTARVGWT